MQSFQGDDFFFKLLNVFRFSPAPKCEWGVNERAREKKKKGRKEMRRKRRTERERKARGEEKDKERKGEMRERKREVKKNES